MPQPKNRSDYIAYFCAEDALDEAAVARNEPKRAKLYRWVSAFVRAYAGVANEMGRAGYSAAETARIKKEVAHCEEAGEAARLASSDHEDLKGFEPDMRRLLDTYIEAGKSGRASAFDEGMGLVDMLAGKGGDALANLPGALEDDEKAVAAVIELNISKEISDERPSNPEYYAKMSESLERLIRKNREDASDYRAYLENLISLAKAVKAGGDEDYPDSIADSKAKKALYDNLGRSEEFALSVHAAVMESRRAKWLGSKVKEDKIRYRIEGALEGREDLTDETFDIVKSQPEYHC